jgi:hypothetical protein
MAKAGVAHRASRVEQLDRSAGHRHLAEIERLPSAADPPAHHDKTGFGTAQRPMDRLIGESVPGRFQLS